MKSQRQTHRILWATNVALALALAWYATRPADPGSAEQAQAEHAPASAALLADEEKSPAGVRVSDEENTRVNRASRFTDNGISTTWPPQPRDIGGVRHLHPQPTGPSTRSARAKDGSPLLPSARQIAENSDEVRILLGNRYAFLDQHRLTAKWTEEHLGDEVNFYSYDQNITVRARVEQGQVVAVESLLPTQYQPPLAPAERDRATALARDYWRQLGDPRIDELEGFAILTYEREASYAVRMAYVTFHYNSTINPELLTWVDLTNERIEKSAVQREEEDR